MGDTNMEFAHKYGKPRNAHVQLISFSSCPLNVVSSRFLISHLFFYLVAIIIYSNSEFSLVIFKKFLSLDLNTSAEWLKLGASSKLGNEITTLKS